MAIFKIYIYIHKTIKNNSHFILININNHILFTPIIFRSNIQKSITYKNENINV